MYNDYQFVRPLVFIKLNKWINIMMRYETTLQACMHSDMHYTQSFTSQSQRATIMSNWCKSYRTQSVSLSFVIPGMHDHCASSPMLTNSSSRLAKVVSTGGLRSNFLDTTIIKRRSFFIATVNDVNLFDSNKRLKLLYRWHFVLQWFNPPINLDLHGLMNYLTTIQLSSLSCDLILNDWKLIGRIALLLNINCRVRE